MTTTASDLPNFRPYLLDDGEPLFLPPDMVTIMSRFGRLGMAAKVDPSDLRTSACVSMPMFAPGSTVRSLRMDPEVSWLPIAWLPERLNTMVEGEDLDHWMIRVALELTSSGLYDTATGDWFDVMAHMGISVDYPEGRARIQRWIDGQDDDKLDNFDLEDYLNVNDPTWSFDSASDMVDDLKIVSYSRASESLSDMIDDAVMSNDASFSDPRQRLDVVVMAAVGAVSYLGDIQHVYGVDFAALRDEIAAMDPDSIGDDNSPVARLHSVLVDIHEDTVGREAELEAIFDSVFGSVDDEDEIIKIAEDEIAKEAVEDEQRPESVDAE